jgi:hypothetical protein
LTIPEEDDKLSQNTVSTNGKVDFIYRQPRSLSLAQKNSKEIQNLGKNHKKQISNYSKNKHINLNAKLGGPETTKMPNLVGAYNEPLNLSYKTDRNEKGVFANKLQRPVLGLGTYINGPNPSSIMSPSQKLNQQSVTIKPQHRQSAGNDMHIKAIKEI